MVYIAVSLLDCSPRHIEVTLDFESPESKEGHTHNEIERDEFMAFESIFTVAHAHTQTHTLTHYICSSLKSVAHVRPRRPTSTPKLVPIEPGPLKEPRRAPVESLRMMVV